MRRLVHFLVMILPATLLLAVAGLTARDLRRMATVDTAAASRELADYLARGTPESFPLPEDPGRREPGRKLVFLFGSSALMLSDGGTFPEYLEQAHPDLRVVNMGVIGVDSLFVRRRVADALEAARPDLIVVYYGDNDYNNAYHRCILPAHFDQFDWLLRLPYLFYDKDRPVSPFASGSFDWFARLNRPRLYNLLQRLGLLRVDREAFASFNRFILEGFARNNEAILRLAGARGIPVVLVTPVGNLRAEPYGDVNETTALFRRGMGTEDYAAALGLLRKAQDAEIFTYDLRAKSPLVEYLRGAERRDVHVLDLERRLEARRFGFGYGDFLDYVHFTDRTHRLLADLLYEFLAERGLTAPGPGAGPRAPSPEPRP